jgi:hypothetical protein
VRLSVINSRPRYNMDVSGHLQAPADFLPFN